MLKNNLKYISLLLLVISLLKRSITGGLKDTIVPTLKSVFLKISIRTGNEIKLVFDENVKLKTKQAISYFTAHEIRTNNITYLLKLFR
jgi:hypothetical protein